MSDILSISEYDYSVGDNNSLTSIIPRLKRLGSYVICTANHTALATRKKELVRKRIDRNFVLEFRMVI